MKSEGYHDKSTADRTSAGSVGTHHAVQTIAVGSVVSGTSVELASLADFSRVVKQREEKIVYYADNQGQNGRMFQGGTGNRLLPMAAGKQCFFMMADGATIYVDAKGFRNLEDAAPVLEAGFEDAQTFERARQLGISRGEEYETFVQSGLATYHDLLAARENGAEQSFRAFLDQKSVLAQRDPFFGRIRTLAEFCEHDVVGHMGASGYGEASELMSAGYVSANDRRAAVDEGYPGAEEYYEAKTLGAESREEFEHARKLGIKTATDLSNLRNLAAELNVRSVLQLPEKIAWSIFESSKPNAVLSPEYLKGELDRFLRSHRVNTVAPLVEGTASLISRMQEGGTTAALVYMDSNGVARRRTLSPSERSAAILDVSNIAWYGSNRETGGAASADSVLRIAEALSDLGVAKLIGIADATLPYDLASRDELQRIRSAVDLTVIKGDESADPHILEAAERLGAMIITNDRYQDWLKNHPWREQHVPRLRVEYSITDSVVRFGERDVELRDVPEKKE